jgi:general secretion pathway protein L
VLDRSEHRRLSRPDVTLAELLNTDLTTIGGWLADFYRWWIGELAEMLPAPARRWVETRPSLSAEPLADGTYRFSRDGRLVMEEPADRRRARPVTLRVSPHEALLREAPAPAIAERDLRRMVALDIDRLTPFRADQVFVAVAASAAGTHRALVGAIRREAALDALQNARAAGLDPRALGVAGSSPAELALDFFPAMREAGVIVDPSPGRTRIWAVIAALVLANLAVAIGRDMFEVRALHAKVDDQRAAVGAVLAVRGRVLNEERRRADILERRADGDPLRMLGVVTAAVPGGAWVDRLAFDGASVRLSGFRQQQVDVAAALRAAPGLTHVRSSETDVLTREAAGQPFDLTADLKKVPGR